MIGILVPGEGSGVTHGVDLVSDIDYYLYLVVRRYDRFGLFMSLWPCG